MFDLLYPYLTAQTGWSGRGNRPCPRALAVALCGASVAATLCGLTVRAHRLLQTYYVRGDWPGMVHLTEKGPGTVCGVCGHHLSVHDRFTGQCCHGTPMGLLAVCIALPLPRPVRALAQRAGCGCRLHPWRH
ncbi:hypothetical protein NE857_26055 [Nocardiopsis exhalans]|uniref:Uncharacterized protein n=1 Tax=Nocardiopsis exhalans TaxID=163604 RepID=A0ABY5D2W7_9ACTN|nr:hypothetical protein [Nocardiopsis exhalans]USY18721.1 hypothetical protein NE857_26055 [Nocardiopsis exhalans]